MSDNDNKEIINALEDALEYLTMSDSESESESESESYSDSGSNDDHSYQELIESPISEDVNYYGCEHYKRKCKLVCPKCDNVYQCRFCHDDVENYYEKPLEEQHEIDRYAIEQIICSICDTKQPVSNKCQNCEIDFSLYFCNKCNLFDDDGINKGIYHCDKCNMCRVSHGQEFYHCDGCNTCVNALGKDTHECMDLKDEMCPVCSELFFTTRSDIFKLKCKHWIHNKCFQGMLMHNNFTCPFCSKLMVDLSDYYQILDQQIENTPMPEEYDGKMTDIMCNECLETNEILIHFYGLKCPSCGSYNTKQVC